MHWWHENTHRVLPVLLETIDFGGTWNLIISLPASSKLNVVGVQCKYIQHPPKYTEQPVLYPCTCTSQWTNTTQAYPTVYCSPLMILQKWKGEKKKKALTLIRCFCGTERFFNTDSNAESVPVRCPGTPPQRGVLGCTRSSSPAGPAPRAPCPRQVCGVSPASSPPGRDCRMTPGRKPSPCSLHAPSSRLLRERLASPGHSHSRPRGFELAWGAAWRGCWSWERCTVGPARRRGRERAAASRHACRERKSSSGGPWWVPDEPDVWSGSSCLAGGVAASSGGAAAACPASWGPWREGRLGRLLRRGHDRQL